MPGLKVHSAEHGTFLANQWQRESSFTPETNLDKVSLRLTNAFQKLDVVRLKLAAK